MKTAEELAEEIAPCWQPNVKDCECPMHIIRPSIAKALTEFAEERVNEDRSRAIDASGFAEKARAEALEEAAKVAEKTFLNPGEIIHVERIRPPTLEEWFNHIAKHIRSLKEVKKT